MDRIGVEKCTCVYDRCGYRETVVYVRLASAPAKESERKPGMLECRWGATAPLFFYRIYIRDRRDEMTVKIGQEGKGRRGKLKDRDRAVIQRTSQRQ